MTTALTVFFAAMGIAAGAALAYLLVQDIRERSTERPFLPGGPISAGGPFDFDFDDHADEAIALLGDDFTEWEKELSKR